MKKPVVSFKNLPTRFPLMATCVAWLMLDRLRAPGWVWGAVGLGMAIIWIACIVGGFRERQIEINDLLEAVVQRGKQ